MNMFYKRLLASLNLRLFDLNTQTTLLDMPGNDLSPEMKTYYEDRLIDHAEPNLVHDQFGDKYPIPKHGGKTIEFRKYSPLDKAMATLTEGVTPDGNKLDVTTIEATVDQYGDYITISDILELTAIDRNLEQATKLLGSQAGRTLDTVTREVITAGTNIMYAPDSAGTEILTRAAIKDDCLLTLDVIFKAAAKLREMNAVPIDDSFVAIVHPNVACDLMLSEKWVDVHKYAQPDNIYKGEIGQIGGVRFVQTTEAKIVGASVKNSVNAATTSSASFVLKTAPDATAIAYLSKAGNKLTIGGAEHTIASYAESTKTVTLSATASLAVNADVISTDAGASGISVYCTMVIASNAFGVTDVAGGGLQHIVKQLGSAGTADPLNQRATTGWKSLKTAERLVEEYMVRVEHACETNPRAASN
jgi:N4-gp56 family major capsid protein